MTTPPTPPPQTPSPSLAGTGAFEELEKLVAAAKEDYLKAIGGNKAACTRVRHSMQAIKQQAQALREKILESRATTP